MIAAREIVAVLLAAGESRRFGMANKLLASLNGKPVAAHASGMLAKCGFRALIAVCSDDDVGAVTATHGFAIVRNVAPKMGLSHSLALGVASVPPGAQAVLICLADMPFVSDLHLRALRAAFDVERAPVVASDLDGRPMPPALFDRSRFAALRDLQGDRGARDVLIAAVRVPAGADVLADIDYPCDLAPGP